MGSVDISSTTLERLPQEFRRLYHIIQTSNGNVEEIIEGVCNIFPGVTPDEIKGEGRRQRVSTPRQIAMFAIRACSALSLEDIGRVLGGRDHTTVLYALTKVKERMTDQGVNPLIFRRGSPLEQQKDTDHLYLL